MPKLKPDHISPTDEEDAVIQSGIALTQKTQNGRRQILPVPALPAKCFRLRCMRR